MKHLLYACIFMLPIGAYAQAVGKPSQKDNVVVIQTPDSAKTALVNLARAFVAQGYIVEKLDAQFLTLSLAPKALSVKFNPVLTVRATARAGAGSELSLSGDYRVEYGDIRFGRPAEFTGSESACNKQTFRAIEKVALTYPAGKVSYAKQ